MEHFTPAGTNNLEHRVETHNVGKVPNTPKAGDR